MAKRKGSLLRQLTVSLGLAIVFLSLASFYYQYRTERHILLNNIRTDLRRQANLLRKWLAQAGSPAEEKRIALHYVQALERLSETGQRIVIVDARQRVVAASDSPEPQDDYARGLLAQVLAPDASPDGVSVEIAGQCIIALPYSAAAPKNGLGGAVLLQQPLTAVDRLADHLMLNSFALLATTLALVVVVVHYVLRIKVHRPMQAIFMQEYRIREGDLARIEAEDPKNEFSDLYGMYNEMVTRIAEQKRAIIDQKDHVAVAQLVRQAISRLTGPLDEILVRSRTLMERASSLTPEDQATLKQIIGNITRIARELKTIVLEGDKSSTWLKHESEKIRDYDKKTGQNKADGKYVID